MKWIEVCSPKESGLGVRRIREINKTILFKWLWRFGTEEMSLWHQIIEEKYGGVSKWELLGTRNPYG